MTPTAKRSGASLSTGATEHTHPTADPFILTLCRLAAPVTIRPPQAPHLKSFHFFMSRYRPSDGSERLYLHMGFFGTLEEAQKYAELMRRAYPHAIAVRAPAALLRKRDSAVPTLAPANDGQTFRAPASQQAGQAADKSLTDTQVLRILETRDAVQGEGSLPENNSAAISLLRPDDTDTRRVLKQAVARGAPVSFVLQLQWSVQPIELSTVPSLSIFRAYTLYTNRSHRDGRFWHSLRMGFFGDTISAKQAAHFVRSSFGSVAVMPISEEERARGETSRVDLSSLAASELQTHAEQQPVERSPSPISPVTSSTTSPAQKKHAGTVSGRTETLEQTLETLAASELWNDEDSFSETGVRHLKIEVQKR
jgi:hypothetical protein